MSTPARPHITTGMACFNVAAPIGRTLESALAQDWPDFEVVDDGSTDSSPALL